MFSAGRCWPVRHGVATEYVRCRNGHACYGYATAVGSGSGPPSSGGTGWPVRRRPPATRDRRAPGRDREQRPGHDRRPLPDGTRHWKHSPTAGAAPGTAAPVMIGTTAAAREAGSARRLSAQPERPRVPRSGESGLLRRDVGWMEAAGVDVAWVWPYRSGSIARGRWTIAVVAMAGAVSSTMLPTELGPSAELLAATILRWDGAPLGARPVRRLRCSWGVTRVRRLPVRCDGRLPGHLTAARRACPIDLLDVPATHSNSFWLVCDRGRGG